MQADGLGFVSADVAEAISSRHAALVCLWAGGRVGVVDCRRAGQQGQVERGAAVVPGRAEQRGGVDHRAKAGVEAAGIARVNVIAAVADAAGAIIAAQAVCHDRAAQQGGPIGVDGGPAAALRQVGAEGGVRQVQGGKDPAQPAAIARPGAVAGKGAVGGE